MTKETRAYVKNKLAERNDEDKNKSCLKVLGNHAAVGAFARFYQENTENLMVVVSSRLLALCEEGNFSSDDFMFYKKGVGDIADFFFECWQEVENSKKKELDKN